MADFALQRMSAEILLGQLKDKRTDKEIEEVLRCDMKLFEFYGCLSRSIFTDKPQ